MAKVSFGKTEGGNPTKSGKVVDVEATTAKPEQEEQPTSEETKAVVPHEPQPVAAIKDDDDISMDEIVLPRINIVQKVGDLSEIYTPGDIVLNKELVIYHPEKDKDVDPLLVTILGFFPTKWTERIPGGALGRLADSKEEVAKLGGTTDYNTWKAKEDTDEEIPYFQPLATALTLIECPKGIDKEAVHFVHEFGDRRFALALWSMKGSAYTAGAKIIKTARKIGHLRKGYATFDYELHTKLKKFPNNNYALIPVLHPGHRHPPEFSTFIKVVLGEEVEEDGSGAIKD